MTEKKQTVKIIIVLALICVFGVAMLAGINVFTAPMIEANNASLAFGPLFAVMPEAKDFTCIYDAADPAASSLTDVPATVCGVYQEISGQGYAVKLSTTKGYTGDPIEFSMGVSTDGKITGAEVTAYNDSKDFGQIEYPLSYVGQDSALADVTLVAGVTYSSAAFKDAVSDAFTLLISNGLVSEGVKGDEQILTELIPQVFSGLANYSGVAQVEELELAEGSGSYIVKALKGLNGSGFAFIAKDGEATLLVLVNTSGNAVIYDVNGIDVTAEHPACAKEAAALAQANSDDLSADEMKRVLDLVGDGASASPLELNGVFSSVTGAYEISDGESTVYGFAARPYGYSNVPMALYYIVDENGAIAAMNAKAFILEKEYFSNYELDVPSYKEGFTGLTRDSFTGEQALISGATVSTDAVTTATNDILAAFSILKTNGGIA